MNLKINFCSQKETENLSSQFFKTNSLIFILVKAIHRLLTLLSAIIFNPSVIT